MNSKMKIGFLGGGNMAKAIMRGINNVQAVELSVVEIDDGARAVLQQQFPTAAVVDAIEKLKDSRIDVWFLAVKPQQLQQALKPLSAILTEQTVVSIAAGIPLSSLGAWLNGHPHVVRAMPNTPAMVGAAMTALVASSQLSAQRRETVDALMKCVGKTLWLPDEALMNAYTAVAGSGPAFVCYFIESLVTAAIDNGFSAPQAQQIVEQTFHGTLSLIQQSDLSVAQLREQVTSKGGTTEAGLNCMYEHKLAQSIQAGINAAIQRGSELGKQK